MKINKQLSPDGNDGGGAESKVNSFAALSASEGLNLEDETPPVPKSIDGADAPPGGDANKGGDEGNHDDAAKLEADRLAKIEADKKPDLGADAKPADVKLDDKGKPIVEEGFANPDGTGKKPDATDDEEGNWVDIAKEVGFEVKENTFEEFKKGIDTFKQTLKAEVEQADVEKRFAHLAPEEQVYIRGLNAGLTVEQINAPKNTLNSLINLSDADLLAADLKARGLKDDVINHQISKLTEDDKLDLEVAPIRKSLEDRLAKIDEINLADIKAIEEQNKTIKENSLKEEFASLEKIASTVGDFMGTKLSEANKKFVLEKYKSGGYNDILNDHNKLFNIFLQEEYGKQALTNAVNKALENERKGRKNDDHNIPIIKRGTGSLNKTQVGEKGKPAMASVFAEDN